MKKEMQKRKERFEYIRNNVKGILSLFRISEKEERFLKSAIENSIRISKTQDLKPGDEKDLDKYFQRLGESICGNQVNSSRVEFIVKSTIEKKKWLFRILRIKQNGLLQLTILIDGEKYFFKCFY
jgi:hypothetical protein